MPEWGERSKYQLSTVKPDLVRVVTTALHMDIMDMTIIEGRRSKKKQNEYYESGKSKVKWPNGKHNVENPDDLANAIDVAPNVNGISWDRNHCLVMAGIILAAAATLGIKIRWGGNWDGDYEPVTDQDFQDLVHFELVD